MTSAHRPVTTATGPSAASDAAVPPRGALRQAPAGPEAQESREEEARLTERDRISREINEVVIRRIYAHIIELTSAKEASRDPQMAERLENLIEELDHTIVEVRRALYST